MVYQTIILMKKLVLNLSLLYQAIQTQLYGPIKLKYTIVKLIFQGNILIFLKRSNLLRTIAPDQHRNKKII